MGRQYRFTPGSLVDYPRTVGGQKSNCRYSGALQSAGRGAVAALAAVPIASRAKTGSAFDIAIAP